MTEDRDQQTKNLKYLKHTLFNKGLDILGCLREIENYLKLMTEAINTYKKDLENENRLSDGENFKVE